MTRKTVLILGARSDMGMAIAHGFAADGCDVQLAAREVANLAPEQTDIELRHRTTVSLHEFDALATDQIAAFLDDLPRLPDIAVCVVGYMGDQAENETDLGAATQVMRSNYEGPALIMGGLAARFETRGAGVLVGVSSVAGLRGRASNYVYGSAKAGFSAFLSGLRNRLASKGVHVLTVLPGFVDTKMTEGMDLPARLLASPQEVAQAVVKATNKRRNVLYVKPIWQVVMTIIRLLPEPIFKKTSL